MARIPMTGGFQVIPEGVHILKITAAKYDEDFGKVIIDMVNVKGQTCRERFDLLTDDGTTNDKAMAAFSFFAKNAMNDFDMEDCDPADLVGRYIKAEIIHKKVPSNKEPGKMVTFANLGDKSPADGFEGEAAPAKSSGLDLSALLGG